MEGRILSINFTGLLVSEVKVSSIHITHITKLLDTITEETQDFIALSDVKIYLCHLSSVQIYTKDNTSTSHPIIHQ